MKYTMKLNKIIIMTLLTFLLMFSGCSKDATIGGLVGGNDSQINLTTQQNNISNLPPVPINPNLNPNTPNIDMNNNQNNLNSIRLGSWNIENWGQAKTNDERINTIVEVLNNYDIVAIQEISNLNEMVDNACIRNDRAMQNTNYMIISNKINQLIGPEYRIHISPQIDDERYAFVYDATKVTLNKCWFSQDSNSGQLCEDSTTGLMEREPYLCSFNINGKELVLQNVHTSPSNNMNELRGLKIFFDVENENIDNLILLGDLNYDCDYLDYDVFNGYDKIDFGDTTVSATDCGYDTMIWKGLKDFSYSGNYNIDSTIVDEVSDHYPISIELIIN